MPEGPEVTFLVEHVLLKQLLHQRPLLLEAVDYHKAGRYADAARRPAHWKTINEALPLKLEGIHKKGKVIFWEWSKGWWMVSKLGMTGWWHVCEQHPKAAVTLRFTGGVSVCYVDPRRFGTIEWTRSFQEEWDELAPDVLVPAEATPQALEERQARVLRTSARQKWKLEDILMDQKCLVSGVGNYLKAEVLYDARLSPLRTWGSLTTEEHLQLYHSLRRVAHDSHEYMIRNPNHYLEYDNDPVLKVYQKQRDPQGNPVVSHKTKAGRTTWWVPAIQI